jgi:hypothetical protein
MVVGDELVRSDLERRNDKKSIEAPEGVTGEQPSIAEEVAVREAETSSASSRVTRLSRYARSSLDSASPASNLPAAEVSR